MQIIGIKQRANDNNNIEIKVIVCLCLLLPLGCCCFFSTSLCVFQFERRWFRQKIIRHTQFRRPLKRFHSYYMSNINSINALYSFYYCFKFSQQSTPFLSIVLTRSTIFMCTKYALYVWMCAHMCVCLFFLFNLRQFFFSESPYRIIASLCSMIKVNLNDSQHKSEGIQMKSLMA